jgi:hypothetical protein
MLLLICNSTFIVMPPEGVSHEQKFPDELLELSL